MGESEWRLGETFCRFLEAPASAAEHISGSEYVTTSLTGKIFEEAEVAYRVYDETNNLMFKDFSGALMTKLSRYSTLVNTPATSFACAIDPSFLTIIISNAELMRHFVTLQDFNTDSDGKTSVKTSSFMYFISNENGTVLLCDDKIIRFNRAKVTLVEVHTSHSGDKKVLSASHTFQETHGDIWLSTRLRLYVSRYSVLLGFLLMQKN